MVPLSYTRTVEPFDVVQTNRHIFAVDAFAHFTVFLIAYLNGVIQWFAREEKGLVAFYGQIQVWHFIADPNAHFGAGSFALDISYREFGLIISRLFVLGNRIETLTTFSIAKIPVVGQCLTFGVFGSCRAQIYTKWFFTRSGTGFQFCHWRQIARVVLDFKQGSILVGRKPFFAILQHVQGSIGVESHVHWVRQGNIGCKTLHIGVLAVFIHRNHHDPIADPIVGEKLAIVVIGETVGGIFEIVGIIHRTSHRVAATFAHQRKFGGCHIGIPHQWRLGSGQFDQTRVVRTFVHWCFGVVGGTCSFGVKIPAAIGFIIGYKKWPAKITCFLGLIEFTMATGATLGTVFACIRAYIAPIHKARVLVHRNTVRIAAAHHKNFGTSFGSACQIHVALRNGISAVRLYFDPQNFTP